MNIARVAACLLLTIPLVAASQSRAEVLLLGEGYDKTMWNWEVSTQKWAAQPKWSPDSPSQPPLPIAQAVEMGEVWLRKRHTDVKQFVIRSISLQPQSSSGPKIVDGWFYRLEFQPMVAGRRLWGGNFIAVVLFDGSVVEPRSEAINSATK